MKQSRLTSQAPPARPLRIAPSQHAPISIGGRPFSRPALASAGLHILIIALLVAGAAVKQGQRASPPPPLAEVELVQLNSPAVGGAPQTPKPTPSTTPPHPPPVPPTRPAPQPQSAPQPAPQPAPAPPRPAASPADTGVPPPRPAAPERQARNAPSPASVPRPAAPPAPPPPDVRLDISGDIGTGLVTGKQIIPAKLDAAVHNAPPAYPPEAAHRGEQGVVELLIHVASDGSAESVDVTKGSGHPALDRSARETVARWHFRPAQQDGIPVRSELPFNVHFELGRQGNQWSE